MQSDTIELGSFTVSAAGEVAGSIVMPANTPGVHEIIFMGIGDGGTDRFITVLVDYGGLPVPGEMYGVYFDGFEPLEDVTVQYLGGLYGRFRSDQTGAIFAGGGDDLICAGDGNDLIVGSGGADIIVTGDGTNVVFAGSGDDVVTGGSGNDLVFAGSGDDTVDGGEGIDHVNGGPGNDSCVNAESVTSC